MLRTSLILILWIPLAMVTTDAVAQERADKKARQDDRGAVEFTESELIWPSIDTHQAAKAKIFGKDFQWQENFSDGESPYFDAMKHELKPGIYAYQVSYVSNEIQERVDAIARVVSKRKELLAGYEEAVEAGDEETVKALYWQANDIRKQIAEMRSKDSIRATSSPSNSKSGSDRESKFESPSRPIFSKGKFLVDEFGMIRVYDRAKAQKESREKLLEERRLNPPAREDEKGKVDY